LPLLVYILTGRKTREKNKQQKKPEDPLCSDTKLKPGEDNTPEYKSYFTHGCVTVMYHPWGREVSSQKLANNSYSKTENLLRYKEVLK
jgi:hypothetical protein